MSDAALSGYAVTMACVGTGETFTVMTEAHVRRVGADNGS